MGPSKEALALADFLIARYGLTADRYQLAYAIMEHEEKAMRAEPEQVGEVQVSPMARMAEALRQKADGERAEYDRRSLAARQPVGHEPIGRVEADESASTGTRVYWNQVTPPAGTLLYAGAPAQLLDLPDDAEEVSTSLGDDAASMLDENPGDERAQNMQRAAEILDALIDGQAVES